MSDSPTSATLPRFLAVTAPPVSNIIHEDNRKLISLPICPEEVVDGIPLVFCMSHAGALLPANFTHPLTKAVAYGQYLMTLKFGGKASKNQVMLFVKIASNSNLWSNEQKAMQLNKVNILSGQNLHPEVSRAITAAADKFDSFV